MKFTVANIISFARVLIAPIFFLLIISDSSVCVSVACFLFALGALTDYFDGYLARKYNEVTEFGNFFDPLADKVLTGAAFIAFVAMDILPLWMVLVIILRDGATTCLRIFAENEGTSIVTSKSAKTKTFLQMVYISYVLLLILLTNISQVNCIRLIYSQSTYLIMLFLTAFTIWTLIEYCMDNKQLLIKLWDKALHSTRR